MPAIGRPLLNLCPAGKKVNIAAKIHLNVCCGGQFGPIRVDDDYRHIGTDWAHLLHALGAHSDPDFLYAQWRLGLHNGWLLKHVPLSLTET